mgnify:CR=1 FL=1
MKYNEDDDKLEFVEESNLLVLRQYRTEKSARYRQV